MKKIRHFIRYNFASRYMLTLWVVVAVLFYFGFVNCNPYINAVVFPLAFVGSVCAYAYVDESKEKNASERLFENKFNKIN